MIEGTGSGFRFGSVQIITDPGGSKAYGSKSTILSKAKTTG
jgi:hypothetical protein